MESGRSRCLAWLVVLLLVLSPVIGAGPLGVASAEEGTPAAEGEPAAPTDPPVDPPVEEVPTETPTATAEAPTEPPAETPTATAPPAEETPSEVPTDVATEAPTGAPTDVPTEAPATEAPSEAPATQTPTETATETATGTPVPDDGEVGGAGNPAVTADQIAITVSCGTDPESIRIKNNGAGPVELKALASLVDRTAAEPFALTRTLQPGQTALYQAGRAARYGTVLTTGYLFTNAAYEADGVKLHSSAGYTYARCAPRPVTPTPTPVVTVDQIKVTLNCTATAESIRVTNNGAAPIKVKGLATMYQPLADEPFAVDRTVQPGKTVIFQAGTDARYGTVLTKQYIFTNSAYDQDGIRVNTSIGKLYKRCDPKPEPVGERWVSVNLSTQWLTAYVGNTPVNSTIVSTGKPGWETPTGTWYTNSKYRYDTMAGNERGESWYVPDVPFVQYFTNWGHALHGKYWNNIYGTPSSHGCVNLPLGFAEWLFYWAPLGMRVYVHY